MRTDDRTQEDSGEDPGGPIFGYAKGKIQEDPNPLNQCGWCKQTLDSPEELDTHTCPGYQGDPYQGNKGSISVGSAWKDGGGWQEDPGESLSIKGMTYDAASLKDVPLLLTDMYWDCECKSNYIKPSDLDECPICDARREEQPDSRVNEVIARNLPLPKAVMDAWYDANRGLREYPQRTLPSDVLIANVGPTHPEFTGADSQENKVRETPSPTPGLTEDHPISNEDYINNEGRNCPYCGSDNLIGGSLEVEDAKALCHVQCVNCSKTWSETWVMEGYHSND